MEAKELLTCSRSAGAAAVKQQRPLRGKKIRSPESSVPFIISAVSVSSYSTLRNTEVSGSSVIFELLESTVELSLSSMPVNW